MERAPQFGVNLSEFFDGKLYHHQVYDAMPWKLWWD